MAGSTGLEPAASAVTGNGIRFVNKLQAAETAKTRGSCIRHCLLWSGFWVEKSGAREALGMRGRNSFVLGLPSAFRMSGLFGRSSISPTGRF
jgi:hypothetical protein